MSDIDAISKGIEALSEQLNKEEHMTDEVFENEEIDWLS